MRTEPGQQEKGVCLLVGMISAQYVYFMFLWKDLRWQEKHRRSAYFQKHLDTGARVCVLSAVSSWDWRTCSPGDFQHQKKGMMKYLLTATHRRIRERQTQWLQIPFSTPVFSFPITSPPTRAELSVCIRAISKWICQIRRKTSNPYDNFKTVLRKWGQARERNRVHFIQRYSIRNSGVTNKSEII